MARQTALPPTLAPRLIGRFAAAAYVSVSPTIFDELMAAGKMPRPRRVSKGRIAWDVRELDAAVDSLPIEGPSMADDTWGDEDAEEAAHVR